MYYFVLICTVSKYRGTELKRPKIRTKIFMGKKPATVTDIALRNVFNDLINRGQVPVLHQFGKELGFTSGNVIRYFLLEERNYPKAKVDSTIKKLTDKYRVSREYLLTGHGKMYNGKPYMVADDVAEVDIHENILSIGQIKKVEQLQKINEELKRKNEELQQLLRSREELIQTQKTLIDVLKK